MMNQPENVITTIKHTITKRCIEPRITLENFVVDLLCTHVSSTKFHLAPRKICQSAHVWPMKRFCFHFAVNGESGSKKSIMTNSNELTATEEKGNYDVTNLKH